MAGLMCAGNTTPVITHVDYPMSINYTGSSSGGTYVPTVDATVSGKTVIGGGLIAVNSSANTDQTISASVTQSGNVFTLAKTASQSSIWYVSGTLRVFYM